MAGQEVDRRPGTERDLGFDLMLITMNPQLLLRGTKAKNKQVGFGSGYFLQNAAIFVRIILEPNRWRVRANHTNVRPVAVNPLSRLVGDPFGRAEQKHANSSFDADSGEQLRHQVAARDSLGQ